MFQRHRDAILKAFNINIPLLMLKEIVIDQENSHCKLFLIGRKEI